MLASPYGEVAVRRLDWLPLSTASPNAAGASPTLGPPLIIAKLAIARLLGEDGNYEEAHSLVESLVSASEPGYKHYVLYVGAAIQVMKAQRNKDRSAQQQAGLLMKRAREEAVAVGDESAASAFALYETALPLLLGEETAKALEYRVSGLAVIEKVIADARRRGEKRLLGRASLYASLFYVDYPESFSGEDLRRGIDALDETVDLIPAGGLSPDEVVFARLRLGALLYAQGWTRLDLASFERALREFEQLSVMSDPITKDQKTAAILMTIICCRI